MRCPSCGFETAPGTRFCSQCGQDMTEGTIKQVPSIFPEVKRNFLLMLGTIGLIGGILVAVGLFTPWATASGRGISLSVSAWDSIIGKTIAGEQVERAIVAFVALAGGVLALVGALWALAAPKVKVSWATLAIGGVLAVVGAAMELSADIPLVEAPILLGIGYGVYLTLVGGILALGGTLGFKKMMYG